MSLTDSLSHLPAAKKLVAAFAAFIGPLPGGDTWRPNHQAMNAGYEFDPQWSSEFVTYGSYVSLVLRPDRVQEGSSSQIMVMGGNG